MSRRNAEVLWRLSDGAGLAAPAAYLPSMVVIWFKRTALSVTLLMLVAILMILLLAAFDVIELPHLYSHQWHEE